MWRYVRQAELGEYRLPVSAPEILVEQWPATAEPRLGPRLQAARPGEHAVQLAAPARAPDAPIEQHRAQRGANWDLAGTGRGLGRLGQRTVPFLNTADADGAALEVDLVPEQPKLLARPRAGEERERIEDTALGVLPRRGDELGDLLGAEDRLLLAAAPSRQVVWHHRCPHPEILL